MQGAMQTAPILGPLDRVTTIGDHEPVVAAARLMRDGRTGCLVVLGEDGRLAGIVTERDILRWACEPGEKAETVGQIMTTDVIWCSPETSLEEARGLMLQHGIRHIPVVAAGIVVGIVSSRDVLAADAAAAGQSTPPS